MVPEGDSTQDDIDALLAEAGLGALDEKAASPQAAAGGGGDDLDNLLSQAQTMDAQLGGAAPPQQRAGLPMEDFKDDAHGVHRDNLDLLMDVNLSLKIELGRTRMYLDDILRLSAGSVVPLDKLAGDPLDILVNDRLVARGEVLVLNENFCVRVTEIVSPEDREEVVS